MNIKTTLFGRSKRDVCLPTIKENATRKYSEAKFTSLRPQGIRFSMAPRRIDMNGLYNSNSVNQKIYKYI